MSVFLELILLKARVMPFIPIFVPIALGVDTYTHRSALWKTGVWGTRGTGQRKICRMESVYLFLFFPTEFRESETFLPGRFWPTIPIYGLMDGTAFVA